MTRPNCACVGCCQQAFAPLKNNYGAVWEGSLSAAPPLDMQVASGGQTLVLRCVHAMLPVHTAFIGLRFPGTCVGSVSQGVTAVSICLCCAAADFKVHISCAAPKHCGRAVLDTVRDLYICAHALVVHTIHTVEALVHPKHVFSSEPQWHHPFHCSVLCCFHCMGRSSSDCLLLNAET